MLILFTVLSVKFLKFVSSFTGIHGGRDRKLAIGNGFVKRFVLTAVCTILTLVLPAGSNFPDTRTNVDFVRGPFFNFRFTNHIITVILFIV